MSRKISNWLAGAVVMGLILLLVTKMEPPKMAKLDILSEALWAGCRSAALKKIGLR